MRYEIDDLESWIKLVDSLGDLCNAVLESSI